MDPAGAVADVSVLVLAGGAGSRFARERPGTDKLLAPLASARPVAGTGSPAGSGSLATLLADLAATAAPVVVVGPPRALPPGVRQVREEPPGGGPLAGVAAGLELVDTPTVVLLGGDQPFAAPAVDRLVTALLAAGADAAVGVDGDGRRQPLLSAHRTAAARRVLAALPDVAGRPLRALFGGAVVEVPVSAEEALDVDTPDDLDAARSVLARRGTGGGTGQAGGAGRT